MSKEIIVIKYGSSSVTDANGMDTERISKYCDDIESIRSRFNVVVISSGAVAAGRSLWVQTDSEQSVNTVSKQSLAAMGSARAFTAWQDELAKRRIKSGQLLVTHKDFSDTDEGPTVRQLLRDNIRSGIVTIGNENDALSVKELALLEYGGENDGLATRVAQEIGATALFLLNNKGGIFDDDEQELGRVEEPEWESILLMAQNRSAKSKEGTGGVYAKVTAAISAASVGIDAYVASAGTSFELILANESGTKFTA